MSRVRLMAVGDIWLRTRNNREPFERIKTEFRNKDVLFGNLETALSIRGKMVEKAHVVNSPPESVKYLKDAGFDIVNIANNHTLDLGSEGFINTVNVLNENAIQFVGGNACAPSKPAILERNGIKLGFLAYTGGYFRVPKEVSLNKLKRNKILSDIQLLQNTCDFIIVSLHWGIEFSHHPSPDQINLAHHLIDSGAHVILGHHSHTVHGIEQYNNGLIAYSLGNFQFDPNPPHGKINRYMILSVDFDRGGISDYTIVPCTINDNFQPEVAEGRERETILKFIDAISDPINNGTITSWWWFEEIAGEYLSGNMRSYQRRIRSHGINPLLECAVWIATPFRMKCYAALLRKRFKNRRR